MVLLRVIIMSSLWDLKKSKNQLLLFQKHKKLETSILQLLFKLINQVNLGFINVEAYRGNNHIAKFLQLHLTKSQLLLELRLQFEHTTDQDKRL